MKLEDAIYPYILIYIGVLCGYFLIDKWETLVLIPIVWSCLGFFAYLLLRRLRNNDS